MSKVTIVIPNWNGMKYLKACLDSASKQTIPVQVIVVDNGSADESVSFLEGYAEERKSEARTGAPSAIEAMRIIPLSDNTGFCHAVNVGIQAARTPYVFLLNNDTELTPDATERLLETIEKRKRVFAVQAKMLSMRKGNPIDDSGDYYCALGWAFTPGKDKAEATYNRRAYITSACGGAAMYRKEIFDEIGLFDEAHFCYLEDVDIGIRAQLYGCPSLYEPAAVVYHAGSASSGSRYNAFKQRITAANNIYLLYKNLPMGMLVLNAPFLLLGTAIKLLFFARRGLGKRYIEGLFEGFSKALENPQRKIPYQTDHLRFYIRFQISLWGNMIRRLIG